MTVGVERERGREDGREDGRVNASLTAVDGSQLDYMDYPGLSPVVLRLDLGMLRANEARVSTSRAFMSSDGHQAE